MKKYIFIYGILLITAAFLLNGCKTPRVEAEAAKETKKGLASFYGKGFQGRETASGETFQKQEMVAAHPSYPLGTTVRVTNLENNRSTEVRVIDRGPSAENQAEGVIIDLSEGAAAKLGLLKDGRTKVQVEVLEWGQSAQK